MIGYNARLKSRTATKNTKKKQPKNKFFGIGTVLYFLFLIAALITSGCLSFIIFWDLFSSFIYKPTIFTQYGSGWSATGLGMLSGTSFAFLKSCEAIMQCIEK